MTDTRSPNKSPWREAKPRRISETDSNVTRRPENLRLSNQTRKKVYDRPIEEDALNDLCGQVAKIGVEKSWTPTGTFGSEFRCEVNLDCEEKDNMNKHFTTRLQCITGMAHYETFSLEELRLLDFLATRMMVVDNLETEETEIITERLRRISSKNSSFEECVAKPTKRKSLWTTTGTGSEKFAPVNDSSMLDDDNSGMIEEVTIRLQSISGMETYQNKSFEELRLEDYLLGLDQKNAPVCDSGRNNDLPERDYSGKSYRASEEELKEIKIKLGEDVVVFVKYHGNEVKTKGKVKFIGRSPAKVFGKLVAGVELEKPVGESNGYFDGIKLFTTPPNHAAIVPIRKVVPMEVFTDCGMDSESSDDEVGGEKNQQQAAIPHFWKKMSRNKYYLKAPLHPKSHEYRITAHKFTSTGGRDNIIKIERIQNEFLYKQYIAKKAEVTKKMERSGKLVERKLFHGTDEDEKIILHGFDRSFAGKNATVYGRGVYFAATARYSDSYALPNINGHRRVFLADVITGYYCQGNSSYISPPVRQSGMKNDLFDSVVNDVQNPNIFVIFKDASAYPTHLITYQ